MNKRKYTKVRAARKQFLKAVGEAKTLQKQWRKLVAAQHRAQKTLRQQVVRAEKRAARAAYHEAWLRQYGLDVIL